MTLSPLCKVTELGSVPESIPELFFKATVLPLAIAQTHRKSRDKTHQGRQNLCFQDRDFQTPIYRTKSMLVLFSQNETMSTYRTPRDTEMQGCLTPLVRWHSTSYNPHTAPPLFTLNHL